MTEEAGRQSGGGQKAFILSCCKPAFMNNKHHFLYLERFFGFFKNCSCTDWYQICWVTLVNILYTDLIQIKHISLESLLQPNTHNPAAIRSKHVNLSRLTLKGK